MSRKKIKTKNLNEIVRASSERKWLVSRGKTKYIDFIDSDRKQLNKFFRSLDDNNSGGISANELLEPLTGLGLVFSLEEVKDIVSSVDDDKSGEIEFTEFLKIIENKNNDDKNVIIHNFFKNLVNGEIDLDSSDEEDYLNPKEFNTDSNKNSIMLTLNNNVSRRGSKRISNINRRTSNINKRMSNIKRLSAMNTNIDNKFNYVHSGFTDSDSDD